MMAEIVNLRRFRKAARRREEADRAAANRQRHGMTRAEREASANERERQARTLDGHRREDGADDEAASPPGKQGE